MTITIKDDLNIAKYLAQIPYATSLALNDSAFESKTGLEGDIKSKLKTRAAIVSKAFAVDKADKNTLTATVRLKDDFHRDVIPQHYYGGLGADIGFERAMMSRGVMDEKSSAIPIKRTTKAGYKKLLANTRSSGSKNFIIPQRSNDPRTRGKEAGVYNRLKSKAKPVVLFTSEAEYQKRMDMLEIVQKVVTRRFTKSFYYWLGRSV